MHRRSCGFAYGVHVWLPLGACTRTTSSARLRMRRQPRLPCHTSGLPYVTASLSVLVGVKSGRACATLRFPASCHFNIKDYLLHRVRRLKHFGSIAGCSLSCRVALDLRCAAAEQHSRFEPGSAQFCSAAGKRVASTSIKQCDILILGVGLRGAGHRGCEPHSAHREPRRLLTGHRHRHRSQRQRHGVHQ